MSGQLTFTLIICGAAIAAGILLGNGAVYFCAIGGAGALASKCIASCEVIAFEDLGCESVKKLEFNSFPLTVAIDAHGGNLFIK